MSDTARYTAPALERGLLILQCFDRQRRQLSGADIARQLKLPRTSVFRLMQTLERLGFIERCGDGQNFQLGIAVLRLGFEHLASLDITQRGLPVIEALRDRCGYSSQLVVRDGTHIVFVAKAVGRSSIFNSVQVGTRLPAHATVLGRVLLGDLDRSALEQLYRDQALTAYTDQTPKTLAQLARMVELDRQRGWGISQGGFESGICSIAAPVFGDHDQILAAINITVPAPSVEPDAAQALSLEVRAAAEQLTVRLRHGRSEDAAASSNDRKTSRTFAHTHG